MNIAVGDLVIKTTGGLEPPFVDRALGFKYSTCIISFHPCNDPSQEN